MNNKKVKFCYFDQSNSSFVEVYGQISQFDEKKFENELYQMKLDSFYSQKPFLKPQLSTGHLISSFRSQSGVINLSFVFSMIHYESLNDIRAKGILRSYFSKIKIDDIIEYNRDEFNTIIREASNPVFPQPETYNGVEREIMSIEANTQALVSSGFNFKTAERLQEEELSKQSFDGPHVYMKVC